VPQLPDRLAGDTYRQAPSASTHKVCNYRLAGQSTPPGGRCSRGHCPSRRRLAEPIQPPGAVSAQQHST